MQLIGRAAKMKQIRVTNICPVFSEVQHMERERLRGNVDMSDCILTHFSRNAQVHSEKNAGLFQPKFGSNMDEPSHLDTFLNTIFNLIVGFVHI